MRLSKKEILFIDETLAQNGVVYADVKLELIDHIASDIEQQIDENNSTFKVAFPIVFNKWEKLLKPTSNSFWLGVVLSGPKVIVDKWVSYAKRQSCFILIYSLLFSIVLTTFLYINHQDKVLSVINDSIRSLFALTLVLTIIGIILIKQSKIKTAYGHMFMRKSFLAFIIFLQFGLKRKENFYLFDFDKSWAYNFLGIFLTICLFLIPFLSLKLILEHFKTIKKYKLI